MARYKKLGYVALNVRDLARSGEFYQDGVGLAFYGTGPGGELFLRCSAGHHDLILYPAGQPGLKRIGWAMENEEELEKLRRRLIGAGLGVAEVPSDECSALHQGRSFRVTEPFTGATFEYYCAMGLADHGAYAPTVAKIQRLGHVVLKTAQFDQAVKFCTGPLNFRTSDAIEGMIHFLRCFPNPFHHSLGIAQGTHSGLHHVNFMVTEIDDIGKAMARFGKKRIDIVYGPGRHPPSDSVFLYFLDPDGMTVEYSFGMEEFPEFDAREPRLLPPERASFDYWDAPYDPRTASVGEIERLGASP